jgi:hypothetical protein
MLLYFRDGISLGNHISSFLRLDRVEPVVQDLEYEVEEWGDVVSSGSESGYVVQDSTPTHSVIRQRDEIKVLSEPTPSRSDPQS